MKCMQNFFDGSAKHHYHAGDQWPGKHTDGKDMSDERKEELLAKGFIGDGDGKVVKASDEKKLPPVPSKAKQTKEK